MKAYLAFYNLAACVGWAYMCYLVFGSLISGESAAEMWVKAGPVLKIVQTSAILEIAHAALKLVRSPVGPTFLQVFSRLALLWGFTAPFAEAHNHWSAYLMIASWSLVEVPRYLFYAMNLFTENVFAPIFKLRYSLFMVLYPSGISGEILQILQVLPLLRDNVFNFYLVFGLLLLYVPGAPFMYFHMMVQRKKAFKKRFAPKRPAPKPQGILFPKNAKGDRSTTEAGRNVWAAATEVVSKNAADMIRSERNWRWKYNKHVVNHVRACCRCGPQGCLDAAQKGLNTFHETFEFLRDGKTTSVAEAMKIYKGSFETGFIKGEGKKPSQYELVVPYLDKKLKGDQLLAQLDKWVEYGTIEPEAGDAIRMASKNSDWLDLSDLNIALLGAGSAMGPLLMLLEHGANVIAVDLDRPAIWSRLIGLARKSCGTMTFPLKRKQSEYKNDEEMFAEAGCNLFTDTPEIKNWLLNLSPEKDMTIGGYAYLDGALHVQVALAMDAIMDGVYKGRATTTSLAFLCTPTDCHVIPEAARKASEKEIKRVPLWQSLISSMTPFLVKNALKPEGDLSLVDGLVRMQGPNYATAKRMQHWRAMVARAAGCPVSTNIAPSSKTLSVVSNTQFAAAYNGMHHFRPMEIMYQETSNAVMGAILIHDLRNKDGVAQPSTKLRHPLELFASGSFHGGIWRMAYKIDSIGEISAVAFYLKHYRVAVITALGALASAISVPFLAGPPHTWTWECPF